MASAGRWDSIGLSKSLSASGAVCVVDAGGIKIKRGVALSGASSP